MGERGIIDRIEEAARKSPTKEAVKCNNVSLNYEKLILCVNAFASKVREHTAESEHVVLFMDRSVELIVSLLSTIKVGKVIVPIDASYPSERIIHMLEQSNCNVVITVEKYSSILEEIIKKVNKDIKICCLDIGFTSDGNPNVRVDQTEIKNLQEETIYNEKCYIYFTSGSTGKPKGIVGKQSSLLHFIDWEIECLHIDETIRVSQLISPSFDPFLRDVFVPLLAGGTLIIPESKLVILDSKELIEFLYKEQIHLAHMGKTVFVHMCSELENDNKLKHLKYILLSGEKLKGIDLHSIYSLYGEDITIVNLYGPTETTLAVSYYITKKEDELLVNVPIGKPISDVSLYILDEKKNECNCEECGEIYIENPFGTYGYLEECFNEERFINREGKVLYKTGDIGKRLSNGNMECLGRMDRQITINGVRIESGEIETVLKELMPDRMVYVKAQKISNDRMFLCAYYDGKEYQDTAYFTKKLEEKLPSYMIPAAFKNVDKFPLLPNGKIDDTNLPLVTFEGNVDWKNDTERSVASVFEQVLGIKIQSVDENFVYLGGNSIDATKVAMKITELFGVAFTTENILRDMTVCKVSERIEVILRNGNQTSNEKKIKKQSIKDTYPMSYVQQSLYVMDMMQEVGASYNVTEAIEIHEPIKEEELKEAYQVMFQENSILRTTFDVDEAGEFIQRISKDAVIEIETLDLTQTFHKSTFFDTQFPDIVKEFVRPFQLNVLPLTRTLLIKLEEEHFILIKDTHHIITDEMSEEIFLQELFHRLHKKEIEENYISYQDYSVWHREKLQLGRFEEAAQYWMNKLQGNNSVLDLPKDYLMPKQRKYLGDSIQIELDKDLIENLKLVASNQSKTISTVFLTAFLILLNRYSGQEAVTIGIPCSGRSLTEIQNTLGMFVNTVPYCISITGKESFEELLHLTFDQMMRMVQYQDYPFGKMIEELHLKPERNRNPIFDVIFNYISDKELSNGNRNKIYLPQLFSKFDLSLIIYEQKEKTVLNFEYATELYKRSRIKSMMVHYINILKELAENQKKTLSQINMLDECDRNSVIQTNTLDEKNVDQTFVDLFLKQVAEHPEKTALISGETITYEELDRISNYIANQIIENYRSNNKIIGVMLKRTPLLFAGIIGVLRAGFTYLPIDPDYPVQRIDHMLEDSGCNLILTDCDKLDEQICILMEWNKIRTASMNKETNHYQSVNLSNIEGDSYLIYTSGSTGKPKGVLLTQKNLSSFCSSIVEEIPFQFESKVLCVTTICFDIFVLESLVPLTVGATVILADENAQRSPYELSNLIINHEITTIQFTPSRLRLCLETLENTKFLQKVKHVIVGGEAFDEKILDYFALDEMTRVFNVYGPTEATVWCSVKEIHKNEKITIGKAMKNAELYVLNSNLQIQPIGVPGELYIGGVCLARGYMNQPVVTKERFIENPYKKGQRIYKTGDMVQRLESGEIEYIGRNDFQVKVRGFRIELSEIEGTMEELPEIQKCICHVLESGSVEKQLVAYYVSNEDINVTDMRKYLSDHLPYYMIPEIFMRIKEIPYTLNGKIDRKALPKPTQKEKIREKEFLVAKNEVEKEIQAIWQQSLGIDNISINDNFFELGGNSILVVRMHSRLNMLYPDKVSIAQVFDNPTIEELAKFITKEEIKHQLKMNVLPEAYFTIETIETSYGLEYEFEEEYELLSYRCKIQQTTVEDMLFALFTYAFSLAIEQDNVHIYKAVNIGRSYFKELSIRLSDYKDLLELIHMEEKNLNTVEITRDTIDTKQKREEISVMFSCNQNIDSNTIGIFDYTIVIDTKDSMSLKCYYNVEKLNSSKVEELFNIYMNVIDVFIQKEE